MFGHAVLVSILLHGMLLFAFPGLRTQDSKPKILPGPIVARLASPAAIPVAAVTAPAVPEPVPAAPPLVEERRVEPPPAPIPPPRPAAVAKPAPAPAPAPVAKPVPSPTPVAAARKPSPPAEEPARPAVEAIAPTSPTTAAAVAPPVAAAPAAPSPSTAPGPLAKADPQPAATVQSAEEAGTLGRYRLALIGAAKRYKRYPRVAMDNNWEGRAEIRVVIGANGMISSISVKSSAGHEILDKQALDMITKAKPLVPIPPSLKGKEFSVDVPVIFSLKEESA